MEASIQQLIEATQGLIFSGVIKSPANSYQIDTAFDDAWLQAVVSKGWTQEPMGDFGNLDNIPNIKPDVLIRSGDARIVVEVEKSNKKTIWFDLIKILMLIGEKVADFGVLIVPRNYAHALGVWNLFQEARFYRSCLLRYAKVDSELLLKIGIVGYTQEVDLGKRWVRMDSNAVRNIKDEAKRRLAKK